MVLPPLLSDAKTEAGRGYQGIGVAGWSSHPKAVGLESCLDSAGHTVGAHVYLPGDGLALTSEAAASSGPLGPPHLIEAAKFFNK